MTNPDNVGGLPELPEPVLDVRTHEFADASPVIRERMPADPYYTADQMRAYGELCRAAPAGGDAEVVRLRQLLAGTQEQFRVVSELLERNQAHHERMMKLMDSAPAGSGEVGQLIGRLYAAARHVDMASKKLPDAFNGWEARDIAEAAALLRKLQQGADYVMVPRVPTDEMETAHRMYGDTSDWWQAVIAASQGQEGGHAGG